MHRLVTILAEVLVQPSSDKVWTYVVNHNTLPGRTLKSEYKARLREGIALALRLAGALNVSDHDTRGVYTE